MSGPDLHQCATFQSNPYSSDGDVSQPDRQTDRQTDTQTANLNPLPWGEIKNILAPVKKNVI